MMSLRFAVENEATRWLSIINVGGSSSSRRKMNGNEKLITRKARKPRAYSFFFNKSF